MKPNGGHKTIDSIREYLQKDYIPYEEYFDLKTYVYQRINFIY